MVVCTHCSIELIPIINWSPSQQKNKRRICKTCNNEEVSRWKKAHSEYVKEYNQRYGKSPKGKASYRKYNKSSKGKARKERYMETAKGQNARRKYLQSPKGRKTRLAIVKRHQQTPKGKLTLIRHNSKHRFLYPLKTILGKPFLGSHLHHLTREIAIYIPKTLHRSIYHNIWTGENMDKINIAAMEWYERGGSVR